MTQSLPSRCSTIRFTLRHPQVLFSEKEAELVSRLPIKPFTVQTASRAWKKSISEAQKVLDDLSSRAILVDIFDNQVLSRHRAMAAVLGAILRLPPSRLWRANR